MLNNIKFAELIGYITASAERMLLIPEIKGIEDRIKDIVEQPSVATMTTIQVRNLVEDMFRAYANGQKIEAVKAYRALTGYGLKESKDAVEGLIADCHKNYNPDTTFKT